MLYRHLLSGLIALVLFCLPAAAAQKPDLQNVDEAALDGQGRAILQANFQAADALALTAENRNLPRFTVLVRPLDNQESPETQPPLGGLIARQVASRLAQHGFPVMQQDAANAVGGALPENPAGAVLTGSYVAGADVFVSVRLVRLEDNLVLAAYEYVLPRSASLRRLLTHKKPAEVWSAHAGRRPALGSQDAVEPPAMPMTELMEFPTLTSPEDDLAEIPLR